MANHNFKKIADQVFEENLTEVNIDTLCKAIQALEGTMACWVLTASPKQEGFTAGSLNPVRDKYGSVIEGYVIDSLKLMRSNKFTLKDAKEYVAYLKEQYYDTLYC